jgi:protoporphyrinogen oxidase
MRSGSGERSRIRPEDDGSYRFEIGGGHWLFGDNPLILKFIDRLTPLKRYHRYSSVYFADSGLNIPYPLQNNLRYLDREIVSRILSEINPAPHRCGTLKNWLLYHFGPTLYDLFFGPFHELYTAHLLHTIAPQDSGKSPIQPKLIAEGAHHSTPSVGYNVTYAYPEECLGELARRMASRCRMHYGKRAVRINTAKKEIFFSDGTAECYDILVSTIPLNRLTELTHLPSPEPAWPYTSVMVLNIGAARGPKCPEEHWLYLPSTRSGFHRVGFYSNVTKDFLPAKARVNDDRVSIYVEKAYPGGERPSPEETNRFSGAAIKELREWGFIGDVEVCDPTWIDVAYTWALPDTHWRKKTIDHLQSLDIYPIGRYGRWKFQGILDSIQEGFTAGASLRAISISVEDFLSA